MKEIKCLSATGQLGHGIIAESFERGVDRKPHVIGADMGSTDIGPYYLGSGNTESSSDMIDRDLELVLVAARKLKVPLIIGSAGSSGAKPHLQKTLDSLKKVSEKNKLSYRLAVIEADIDKEYIKRRIREKRVSPCGPLAELTEKDVDDAARIVAQMGTEPFLKALEAEPDVIIAGRACDASVHAALPIARGFDPGLAMHAAKVIECASFAADPGGRDPIMATIRDDHFILESMNPVRHCTPISVAAHSLYEQPSPFEVVEPGGRLDMTNSTYTAEDEHRTRVTGSKWETMPYTLKLEGVKKTGYRCFSMGAMRCPIANAKLDEVFEGVEGITRGILKGKYEESDYRLKFRVYGRDGIMQSREPNRDFVPNEVFVITDVVGKTQAIADGVCSVARYYLLHYFYKDIQATAGNVAVPFVPCDIPVGEVFEFSIYHLVREDDPLALFPIKHVRVNGGEFKWQN
jgi:hypothetical protein